MTEATMPPESPSEARGRLWSKCGQAITATMRDIKCLYLIMRHPDTPWHARTALFVPVAYVCSPIQLIPNFIPVIGQLDDLFVIWIANRLVEQLVSEDIRKECREAVERPKSKTAKDELSTQATTEETLAIEAT